MRKYTEEQLDRKGWLVYAALYANLAEEALNQLMTAIDWAFDDGKEGEIDDYYKSIAKHTEELERLNKFLIKEQENLRKKGVRE